uniref:NADP-dependent oxidoreductase domain-containing protein 1 n=1 Tax=Lates calcarifer TaxID=8187 RepID=A0A4W6F1B1_LATCA
MADVAADLSSFSFETGLTDDEKKLLYLRARAAGLTFCGCAHALYLCKLVKRQTETQQHQEKDLCVGILGLGHMGKQLLLSLLELTGIKPSHIKVSTRRPESAGTLKYLFRCFFNNRRLAAWADVLFLCCLPSHLPKVCADLHSHLSKRCLVYSFVSAVPVTRLAELLGHNFILKPQYDFVSADRYPLLIEASCPLTMSGILSWVCAVLYSLLNICTSAGLGSSDALSLINSLFKEKWTHAVQLNAQSFVSSSYASSLLGDELFSWISLTDAQSKETPLLRFLSSNKSVQQCIAAEYKSLLDTPVMLDSYCTH